ncbi:hypothetical protein DH2020_000861 [Rehmannia glutinosa]|uniref:B-like cyclin n=1 Tax=Rehmannia glutinosa TaxID=99300 RepID=A0ABR0XXT8_REHGL
MASRVLVPEQPRVGGGKQKNGQAEVRNRRVLRDIGNLVIAPAFVGKDGAGKAAIHHKKETLKPKNEAVISPHKEESYKNGIKLKEGSSKKPNKTLTSILTARSKVACGITKKPKDLIVDIDAADVDDELAAVEYIEDIYNFYKLTEDDGRVHDYMDSQREINSKMRAILVDWLIEVHKKFELMPESLYLTVNIVDRFLSVKTVSRRELQLVGISSMLIACKYEEIWAPEVSDFIAISDNAYVREQVLLMEKAILGKLEWYLTVPTPYVFLVRYIKASLPADKEMENMTFFYAELGLTNYSTIINYCPSMLAASAVYAARCTLSRSRPLWTDTLKHHTGYAENQLMECAKLLVSFHCGVAENKLKAVYRKYSNARGLLLLCFLQQEYLVSLTEAEQKGIELADEDVEVSKEECLRSLFKKVLEWREGVDMKKENFFYIDMWVQIWDLHAHWISSEVGLKIGKIFPSVKDVFIPKTGSIKGRYLKINVSIEIEKPLMRGINLKLKGEAHWVNFKYENLIGCCFYCGWIGHHERFCEERKTDILQNNLKEGRFGEWLKAEDLSVGFRTGRMFPTRAQLSPSKYVASSSRNEKSEASEQKGRKENSNSQTKYSPLEKSDFIATNAEFTLKETKSPVIHKDSCLRDGMQGLEGPLSVQNSVEQPEKLQLGEIQSYNSKERIPLMDVSNLDCLKERQVSSESSGLGKTWSR